MFKKSRNTQTLLTAGLVAGLCFATTAQAGVIVDLFTDPIGGTQTVATQTLLATVNNQAGPFPVANVIGGYRDLSVQKTADSVGGVNVGTSTLQVDAGTLTLSNDIGNKSVGVVTWDGSNVAGNLGTGVNTTGLGGADLTLGGATQIIADVLQADLGFDYKITVWDMDGDKSVLSAGVQFAVTSPTSAHYLFDWFNLASGNYCDGVAAPPACSDPTTQLNFSIARSGTGDGVIDFTKIGALQLELSNASTFSVDLALGTIQTVPEPGALALVGIALVGFGVAGRRNRAL